MPAIPTTTFNTLTTRSNASQPRRAALFDEASDAGFRTAGPDIEDDGAEDCGTEDGGAVATFADGVMMRVRVCGSNQCRWLAKPTAITATIRPMTTHTTLLIGNPVGELNGWRCARPRWRKEDNSVNGT